MSDDVKKLTQIINAIKYCGGRVNVSLASKNGNELAERLEALNKSVYAYLEFIEPYLKNAHD